MEEAIKLLDEAIYKYSRNPKPLPLEIVEDFQKIKRLLEDNNIPTPKVEEVKNQSNKNSKEKIQEITEEQYNNEVPKNEDMTFSTMEVEDPIELIRKRYEEKFQKKPFM